MVVDGQQLDGSDTQVLQVGDDRRIGEAGVGAAEMFRDRRMQLGSPTCSS